MKILVLDQFSEIGGAQACLLSGFEAMRARDWQVAVGLPGNGPLFCRARELGCAPFRISCSALGLGNKSLGDAARFLIETPRLAREIRNDANRFGPDLVYVNGPRLLPAVALADLRLPVLYHAHSYLPPGMPRTLAGEALRRLRGSIVACCRFVADVWKPVAPSGGVSVIYNGVAGPTCSSATGGSHADEPRARLETGFLALRCSEGRAQGEGVRPARIGCIGRISPEKGQMEFVAAAAVIHRARPETGFAVYGVPMFSGDAARYYKEVRAAARSLPIEFPGWVRDIYGALSQLDLLLVPSAPAEAGTRVIPEAFAAGVPVIAFHSGGIPEIIEHGRTGLLVSSVEEMAACAFALLWGDPARRCSVVRAAREEWQSRFTIQRYQSELMEAVEAAPRGIRYVPPALGPRSPMRRP